jgi:uncharacterized membrane protein
MTKEGITMTDVTVTESGDKLVLTATFDTLGGANLAVEKLYSLEKEGLLDVDNTVTISKNAWNELDVKQAADVTPEQGAGLGALVGGILGMIFPPSVLATTTLGAAIGGMTASLRGAQLDSAEIQAMADAMAPGTSMMIAVVEPEWQEEVAAALQGLASKIGWTVMNRATVNSLQQGGS